jgi:hypothetical protein
MRIITKHKSFNKKGIFFTFIALTLMVALIILFNPSGIVTVEDTIAVKTRVSSINDLVVDLKTSYLENILKVSSNKAVIALTDYVGANGPFSDLDELQTFYSEAMLEGTINGISQPIMDGNTIINWTDRMANVSRNSLNVETKFEIGNVAISQLRSFFIELNLSLNITVTSEASLWNITDHNVNAELSIQKFDDPYYLINGEYSNQINKSDVPFDEWDAAKVNDHIEKGTYRYDELAPSFLKRFTTDISPTKCCGIESIVDSTKISFQKDVSYTDFVFWETSSDCPNLNLYTASGISSNVKFDLPHLVLYNISQGSSQICPP